LIIPAASPLRPVLSWGRVTTGPFSSTTRGREASKQAAIQERVEKIAAAAEERRQARLQAQALVASKAKVSEKQRVDGMLAKARASKKRKHSDWEEGDNI
jgi:hypothetical protein